MNVRYGLIAGNGRFPFLLLDAARDMGIHMVVVAVKEEAYPEIENHAAQVHWVSLGQLGRLLKIFREEGIHQAVMAGQVKHKQIFSSIVPDLHMMKLLAGLARKNTDSLIGAVADYLAKEGITLVDSTQFLKPLMAVAGILTKRGPAEEEAVDVAYGLTAAREIARLDIGQTVVVKDQAVIAVEAMEGTDAAIRRAGEVCGRPGMSVIKVSKPGQDMRFDVPVIGPGTIETMKAAGASALSVDAGKTLLLDKPVILETANRWGITIVAQEIRQ